MLVALSFLCFLYFIVCKIVGCRKAGDYLLPSTFYLPVVYVSFFIPNYHCTNEVSFSIFYFGE